MARAMVHQFPAGSAGRSGWPRRVYARGPVSPTVDLNKLVTMASIVEKETAAPEERAAS